MRVCYECGTGVLQPTNLHGKPITHREFSLVFDEDCDVEMCDNPECGDWVVGSKNVQQISDAIDRLYNARMRERVK